MFSKELKIKFEAMRKNVKVIYLYIFGFALIMLCISKFSYVQDQVINHYFFSLPKLFTGIEAPLLEGNTFLGELTHLDLITKLKIKNSSNTLQNFNPNSTKARLLLNCDKKQDQDSLNFLVGLDCQAIEPYNPLKLFGIAYENGAVVNLKQKTIPEGPIRKIDFVKAVLVFGIYIISSELVSEHELERAAKILAKYIDNDEDGKADNPEMLQHLQNFNLVIGYLYSYKDSENFWLSKLGNREYKDFCEIFFCHIHFFEQWLVSSSEHFYVGSCGDENNVAQGQRFDWILWYMLLPICYYGYVENFNHEQKNIVSAALKKAKDEKIFKRSYAIDEEIELSDFLCWVILTKLTALQHHYDENVASVWQLREPDSLINLGKEFSSFLDELPHIPKVIPKGEYNSSSVV